MVGEPVEVWIEIRNDGPVGLTVPVRLTFPSASKRPEIRSLRVGPGETARVSFDWNTSNYDAGTHLLRAAILLDNNVTVGQTSAELRLLLTPLVIMATIVDVAVSPESPRVGEPVTITVTVRNDGRIPANIPITLHFLSGDKQPETRRPRIDAGSYRHDFLHVAYQPLPARYPRSLLSLWQAPRQQRTGSRSNSSRRLSTSLSSAWAPTLARRPSRVRPCKSG